MKIKKFTAKDIKEGKRLVIEELGEEAVILSNRVLKDSDGEEFIEIVAALDDAGLKSKPQFGNEITETKSAVNRFTTKTQAQHGNEIILQEIDNLKEMISEIGDSIKFRNTASMSSALSKLYKKLRNVDINEELALRIVSRISVAGAVNDYDEAVFEARKILLDGIEISKPLQKTGKTKIVMLVGTTGSGKTATLVKLAIITKLVFNASNLIVSADNYKVGAGEQLETFSTIASIPFRAAYSPEDLRNILDEKDKRDFIFIDTTGFSQKNSEQLKSLNDYIKAASPDMIILTLPATVSGLHAASVLDKMKSVAIDSLIITKTDESESIASVLSIIREYKIPISYIANGVKIPEDIQPADKVILGKLSLKD
ncbi:MAG: hypothetical protein WC313_04065 [Candidatus Kapaibacterium sp.]|jgi:flagellar biosynthesis protein FlhF|nr:hypothetical protein [Candidatus Kapabacteria bacterium]